MTTTDRVGARVELHDVRLAYGRHVVLRSVTGDWGAGANAVIGRNGVGKSTLFRAVAGLERVRGGSIEVGNGSSALPDAWVRFAPQHCPGARLLTVHQLLTYLALLDGVRRSETDDRVASALHRVNLAGVGHVRSSSLSGGMAKRLGIAQALLVEPDVLLLDEPTSGLDPVQRLEIDSLIAELAQQCVVVFSTHDMDEVVSIASQFMVLSEGGVAQAGATASTSAAELVDLLAALPDPVAKRVA